MSPPPSVLRPLSVLVVDDLADAAESLAAVLALCGFLARTALTAAAALALAAADPTDAAVLELLLPDLDGWELARRLAALSPGRRPLLVGLTWAGGGEARRRSAEAGLDLHLVKPADPAVLVGVLRRFARVLGPG